MKLEDIDPGKLEAWRLFLVAHARVVPRLAAELLRECGITLPWYEVLLQLNEAPGRRLRLQELATSVLLSQSRITRLVGEMVMAGHVRRERSSEDGRGANAVLTDAGKKALRTAAPTHLRGVEEHFTVHLTAAEAKALTSALRKVLEAVEGSPEPAGRSALTR